MIRSFSPVPTFQKTFDFKVNGSMKFRVHDAVNFLIDWGNGTGFVAIPDGTSEPSNTSASGIIRCKGSASRIFFGGYAGLTSTNLLDILTPISRGIVGITDCTNLFIGCSNLGPTLTCPNFIAGSNITNLTTLFMNCNKLNDPNLNQLDTSKITNMNAMFFGSQMKFNQPIGNWNTSKVTNMSQMFYTNWNFNQDLSGWDTSSVTTMASMFRGTFYFNQSLAAWNITSITTLEDMFRQNTSFSRANYDATLISWAAQDVKNGVLFTNTPCKYSAGAAKDARDHLTGVHGWVITDGGQA